MWKILTSVFMKVLEIGAKLYFYNQVKKLGKKEVENENLKDTLDDVKSKHKALDEARSSGYTDKRSKRVLNKYTKSE